MKNIHGLMLVGCSALALAGCGPSDIASPGTGGNVIINPAPTPAPSPTPTGPTGVTPAAACPTIGSTGQLTDAGTLAGPTGTWRICTLPRVLDRNVELPKIAGLVYQMNGRVDVGCDGGFSVPTTGAPFATTTVGCPTANLTADTNVTLTIQPGVIVIAAPGASWLAVNRGNKISAVGTATAPIIFTSRDNLVGTNTDSSQGQWGGVVLLGRAPTTGPCQVGSVGSNTCERNTEGAADLARYGGTDNAYNAGRMSYVQLRYSGFVLSGNNELQALTTGGVGTGTTLDHIQSHNSSDDGAEFFGGTVNLKYYVATGADDDSLDVDMGAQMNVQHAIMIQREGRGDTLMEIDSNGDETDTPRTKLTVANFYAGQAGVAADNAANGQASLFFRGNSDVTLINGIVNTPQNECIRINATGTTPATVTARSVVMNCSGTGSAKYLGTGTGNSAAAVQAQFASGTNLNNDSYTPTLTSLFINGTNENGVNGFDAKTLSTFFDTTTWIGAARASDTWFQGWTCNSATANFGSTSGLCTSLPVT